MTGASGLRVTKSLNGGQAAGQISFATLIASGSRYVFQDVSTAQVIDNPGPIRVGGQASFHLLRMTVIPQINAECEAP
jgi:hypothetical protein